MQAAVVTEYSFQCILSLTSLETASTRSWWKYSSWKYLERQPMPHETRMHRFSASWNKTFCFCNECLTNVQLVGENALLTVSINNISVAFFSQVKTLIHWRMKPCFRRSYTPSDNKYCILHVEGDHNYYTKWYFGAFLIESISKLSV